MESTNMKALYIVVNADLRNKWLIIYVPGFYRATIINARGVSALHKEIMALVWTRRKKWY